MRRIPSMSKANPVCQTRTWRAAGREGCHGSGFAKPNHAAQADAPGRNSIDVRYSRNAHDRRLAMVMANSNLLHSGHPPLEPSARRNERVSSYCSNIDPAVANARSHGGRYASVRPGMPQVLKPLRPGHFQEALQRVFFSAPDDHVPHELVRTGLNDQN